MTPKVEWSPRRLLNASVPQARDGFASWILALSSAELASARSHALELAEGAEYRSRPFSMTGETAD